MHGFAWKGHHFMGSDDDEIGDGGVRREERETLAVGVESENLGAE